MSQPPSKNSLFFPGRFSIAQATEAGLRPLVLLPPLSQRWDGRCTLSYLGLTFVFNLLEVRTRKLPKT